MSARGRLAVFYAYVHSDPFLELNSGFADLVIDGPLILQGPCGHSMPVQLITWKNRAYLAAGWPEFVHCNGIKEGDILFCQLDKELKMSVVICSQTADMNMYVKRVLCRKMMSFEHEIRDQGKRNLDQQQKADKRKQIYNQANKGGASSEMQMKERSQKSSKQAHRSKKRIVQSEDWENDLEIHLKEGAQICKDVSKRHFIELDEDTDNANGEEQYSNRHFTQSVEDGKDDGAYDQDVKLKGDHPQIDKERDFKSGKEPDLLTRDECCNKNDDDNNADDDNVYVDESKGQLKDKSHELHKEPRKAASRSERLQKRIEEFRKGLSNTNFAIIVRKHHLLSGCSLPAEYEMHMPRKDEEVKIIGPDGNGTLVKRNKSCHPRLSRGWPKFRHHYNLRLGDVICFEVFDQSLWKAHILKSQKV